MGLNSNTFATLLRISVFFTFVCWTVAEPTAALNRDQYFSIVNSILNLTQGTPNRITFGNATYLSAPPHSVVKNNFILRFDSTCPFWDTVNAKMMDALHHLGCSMGYTYSKSLNGCQVTFFPSTAAPSLPLDLLNQLPCLDSIEEIQVMKSTQTQAPVPWGLDRIDQVSGLNQKYQFTLSGKNTHVYVLDSGIDSSHPEFRGRAELAYNVTSLPRYVLANSTDCSGHGTHVSAIIAGNAVGVAKNAYIHAVRVLGCEDSTNADVIEAIDWVIQNHKKPALINMSLGSVPDPATGQYLPIPSLNDAVQRAIDAGITVVVAAGNYNLNVCTGSLSNVKNLIMVGASGINSHNQDVKSTFSNFGPCLDLFAPGTNIISAFPGAQYAYLSGTSQSCPFVSGVVAQILEVFPTLLPGDVEKLLMNISTKNIIKDAPGTTGSFLRVFNANIPLDTVAAQIYPYPESLSALLSPQSSISWRLALIISFAALVALFFIAIIAVTVRRALLKRKSPTVSPKPANSPIKGTASAALEKGEFSTSIHTASKKKGRKDSLKHVEMSETVIIPFAAPSTSSRMLLVKSGATPVLKPQAAEPMSYLYAEADSVDPATAHNQVLMLPEFAPFEEGYWTEDDRFPALDEYDSRSLNPRREPRPSIQSTRKASAPLLTPVQPSKAKFVPSRKSSLLQDALALSPPSMKPRKNSALPKPSPPSSNPPNNPNFYPSLPPIFDGRFSFSLSDPEPVEAFMTSSNSNTKSYFSITELYSAPTLSTEFEPAISSPILSTSTVEATTLLPIPVTCESEPSSLPFPLSFEPEISPLPFPLSFEPETSPLQAKGSSPKPVSPLATSLISIPTSDYIQLPSPRPPRSQESPAPLTTKEISKSVAPSTPSESSNSKSDTTTKTSEKKSTYNRVTFTLLPNFSMSDSNEISDFLGGM